MSSPRVRRRRAPAPAAVLRAERLQRRALDEAVARDGDHHLARLDQAFVVLIGSDILDVGHARRGDLLARGQESPRASPPCGGCASRGCPAIPRSSRRLPSARPGSSRAPARSGAAGAVPGCRAPARRSDARCCLGRSTLPGSSISASSDSTISSAGQSRSISAARAVAASGLARISRITSSMLATAMARPTSRCARSRALSRSNRARRRITSSRKRMKQASSVLQPHLPRLAVVQRQHVDAEAGLQTG